MRKSIGAALAFSTVLIMLAGAAENNANLTAKQTLKDNQSAVVWVSAVNKIQISGKGAMMMPSEELKVETLGTVIDPSGLTVVAASMLDKASGFLGDMLQQMSARGADNAKFDAKSDISNIKIRMADGQEIPAKIALTDPDLDLSFLMPEKTEGKPLPPFAFINPNSQTKPQLLDEILIIGRKGKHLDRQPSMIISRIASIVTKPRPCYVPSEPGPSGIPVFTLDAKLLGIMGLRKNKADAQSGGMLGMMSMDENSMPAPVIIPAAEILEAAGQALKKTAAADATGAVGGQPAQADKPVQTGKSANPENPAVKKP
ncbi:MAG: trypsin-like peptidase domain-containing protein [Lentisphaerae bacterium]|nr:trypsin-like peptidase domain-containing protein [Lentisphaerota bacterium]